jgi:hypothetical protein
MFFKEMAPGRRLENILRLEVDRVLSGSIPSNGARSRPFQYFVCSLICS